MQKYADSWSILAKTVTVLVPAHHHVDHHDDSDGQDDDHYGDDGCGNRYQLTKAQILCWDFLAHLRHCCEFHFLILSSHSNANM